MNIDSDGDPQSYGPLFTPNINPLDSLENAGWVQPDHVPDTAGRERDEFKFRGNKQRKAAYDAGIESARTEFEDLKKQRLALDPKTVEQRTKDLDQKIVDADKALNDLKQQKAPPQKIGDASKALDDLNKQKADLDPQKVATEREDLEKKKIPDAYKKIYALNPYEFKPPPNGQEQLWQKERWRYELWQPGDRNKPAKLGTFFWDWYGVQSMTPAGASGATPEPGGKKPMIYEPRFMHDPGPIRHQMYEDVFGRFPVVQQGDEPGPGYFVSRLAVTVNTRFPEWDQRSTVAPSARDVQPYGSVETQLAFEAKVGKGDTVLAINCDGGNSLEFPFLDSGFGDAVAECSWTAFTSLGGTFSRGPGGTGKLVKSSEPVFLYLAFPNKQTPAAVLSQIGAFDNGDEFTTILAFLVQATFQRSGDPLQQYEFRKKHPELNQNPAITNLATAIDTNLRRSGFTIR
jgi:hypothetical protein